MSISKDDYSRMTKTYSPRSPVLKDCLKAFCVGGFICSVAQGLTMIFMTLNFSEDEARTLSMLSVIAVTAVLTGFGVFDKIAKHAGAGTMVPISGFANSVVSPALEFKAEGTITGTAAQMFSIAGPVIVFGCSSAAVYGVIVYILGV